MPDTLVFREATSLRADTDPADMTIVISQPSAPVLVDYYTGGEVIQIVSGGPRGAQGEAGVNVITSATAPPTPDAGTFWHDTTNSLLKVYLGGEWWTLSRDTHTHFHREVLGALTAGVWLTVTHNLDNDTPLVTFVEVSSAEAVVLDWKVTGVNTIQVKSDLTLAADSIRVSVAG